MLAGSWAAIVGVWDSISLLSDILKDPRKFVERLGSSADQLAELARKFPGNDGKSQLLASDEAALCLLLRTASLWLGDAATQRNRRQNCRSGFNGRGAAAHRHV